MQNALQSHQLRVENIDVSVKISVVNLLNFFMKLMMDLNHVNIFDIRIPDDLTQKTTPNEDSAYLGQSSYLSRKLIASVLF